MVHEYAVTYPSVLLYILSEFLFVFYQSARVMEGGYISVDNSGLLQKVNRRKTHNVAHEELIKQVSW